jgi:hypothetical protein
MCTYVVLNTKYTIMRIHISMKNWYCGEYSLLAVYVLDCLQCFMTKDDWLYVSGQRVLQDICCSECVN